MGRVECGSGTALWMALILSVPAFGAARAEDLPALPPGWSDPADLRSVIEPASPFRLTADAQTHERAERCLATAVYYEAADQVREGQEAVAQVVLNRLRHPGFPKSVCGVVYQGAPNRGCQFTFACDGSLARSPDVRGWQAAEAVAQRALDGFVAAGIGVSTHYHTTWVHPAWSAKMTPTLRIGAHQFYRVAGGATLLTGIYAGAEPDVAFDAAKRSAPGPVRGRMTLASVELARAPPSPRAASFSIWGLQMAVVIPKRSGVLLVSEASASSSDLTGPPAPPPVVGAGAPGS